MRKTESPAWRQFEEEVRLLVEEFGYQAETTRSAGDGGVDVLGQGPRGKVIIQCKLLGGNKVGGPIIDQLAGARVREKAAHAICITTSGFTKQAINFAAASDILLVDGDGLLGLCKQRDLTIASLTRLVRAPSMVFEIRKPRAILGRGSHCDIVIDEPTVSRRHAVLDRDGLRLQLHDCGSINGTLINGQRVHRPCLLSCGDSIQVGRCVLTVELRTAGSDRGSCVAGRRPRDA